MQDFFQVWLGNLQFITLLTSHLGIIEGRARGSDLAYVRYLFLRGWRQKHVGGTKKGRLKRLGSPPGK